MSSIQSAAPLITVREAVLYLLRDLGMTSIFGNPGSTELPLFFDFPDDFRYVLGLQESVVVGMADGYAQATRNAAFINLHAATGLGHAMGNVFTAYKNKTPLVITAGQQARAILPFDPFLGAKQAAEMPKPYVKWSIEPARAQDVPLALARGYQIAMTPPMGPVFVSIPSDDWEALTERVHPHEVSRSTRPDADQIIRAARLLDAARSPALVVGAAVDRDGAWHEVLKLAELHEARVYVAPMSGRCSFPEHHRLFGGFLPAMRERIVSKLQDHDVIAAVGAPVFTYHVDGTGPRIPKGACLVQLTDDPENAAWSPSGLSIICGIRQGVQDLLDNCVPAVRPALAPLARKPLLDMPEPGERMSAAYVLQTLDQARPPSSVIVEESPSTRSTMHDRLPIYETETFYTMCSGGLGYGLPAAVGMALGRPKDKVICLVGDGSAMYSIQALWSAAQFKLPIAFVLLNNQKYAALREFATIFGYDPAAPIVGTDLPDIDFVKMAGSMGVKALRVAEAAQLRPALDRVLSAKAPMLVEVEIA